jgi:hypothetical protein
MCSVVIHAPWPALTDNYVSLLMDMVILMLPIDRRSGDRLEILIMLDLGLHVLLHCVCMVCFGASIHFVQNI